MPINLRYDLRLRFNRTLALRLDAAWRQIDRMNELAIKPSWSDAFHANRMKRSFIRHRLVYRIKARVHVVFRVVAGASFYCQKIEQLPTVSDERVLRRLQGYVTSLSGAKPFQIKQLTSRFFLMMPEGENYKVSNCYYRLLDSKDAEAKERFSFRGTGAFWFYPTPAEVRIEEYGDDYTEYGFETSRRAHVRVLLPRIAETVLVNGVSADEVLPKACGDQSR